MLTFVLLPNHQAGTEGFTSSQFFFNGNSCTVPKGNTCIPFDLLKSNVMGRRGKEPQYFLHQTKLMHCFLQALDRLV